VLTSLGGLHRGGNRNSHVIIDRENYHALRRLQYTHEGKIDIIYIDPPYNTGKDNFLYNDCYVNDEDKYRHSKWLESM